MGEETVENVIEIHGGLTIEVDDAWRMQECRLA
jgi:hypothetical protein